MQLTFNYHHTYCFKAALHKILVSMLQENILPSATDEGIRSFVQTVGPNPIFVHIRLESDHI